MFDLEQSIAEWRRQMLAAGIKSPVPLEELESHLREEIERQVKSRQKTQKAFNIAVLQVGRAELLNDEFKKADGVKKKLLQSMKDFQDVGLLVLAAFAVFFSFRYVLWWPPLGYTPVPHLFNSPGQLFAIYNELGGRGQIPSAFPQFLFLVELLFLLLILRYAGAHQARKNVNVQKSLKRTILFGQGIMGLEVLFTAAPFFGLVMAYVTCVACVIILRRQVRVAKASS